MKDLIMNNIFVKTILGFSGWIWGDPMLYILGLGGLFLFFRMGGIQILHFPYVWSQTLGKFFKKDENSESSGTLKPIQALCTALANTIGAGNIVGVGLAIAWGGPGAVFWMWLTAILGMGTKFTEAVLGQKYRIKNEHGEFVGGPQYFLAKGLKKYHLGWLGVAYAVALICECFGDTMLQCNSMVNALKEAYGWNIYIVGIISTATIAYGLWGRVERIGKMASKVVPLMAVIYIASTLIFIAYNITRVPALFAMIFKYAFTPMAATGGFAGASVASVMRWGIARGAYSNEAGDGTASIAHATAITDHPVRQGLFAIMEVFLDTIVVCSCTAFAILLSGVWTAPNVADKAAVLTTVAFASEWGFIGKSIVAISLTMFAWTSLLAYAWYGEKQAEFLGGPKAALVIRCILICGVFVGVFWEADVLWPFNDLFFALMILPNMVGVLLMHGEVRELVKEYFHTPGKYYLKDIADKK